MMSLNPYLNFLGNTEEAFNFYKSVFGGEFLNIQRFGDIPTDDSASEWKMSESDKNKIMHISLAIGDNSVLMGTDALESMGHKLTIGNNFYISLNLDNRTETERIFNSLSAGGEIEMQLQDTFWGAYYGSFKDKFGIQWMLNCEN